MKLYNLTHGTKTTISAASMEILLGDTIRIECDKPTNLFATLSLAENQPNVCILRLNNRTTGRIQLERIAIRDLPSRLSSIGKMLIGLSE